MFQPNGVNLILVLNFGVILGSYVREKLSSDIKKKTLKSQNNIERQVKSLKYVTAGRIGSL